MPKLKNNKIYLNGFFPEFELRRRETGFKCKIGWENKIKYALYSSLLPSTSWEPITDVLRCNSQTPSNIHHGGVFNLEFSPDGKQLVAACEKNAIMLFDPLTRKRIYDVDNAHSNCVNCIKFLDNRVFASCSDDKTAALWDVRNLKRRIVNLLGHHNWVKNIEYSAEDGLLVTSGFDGRILGWNINSYSEDSIKCKQLFSMSGLMRMRLTPDMTKLIICTSGGYMVLVHNLSLEHLAEDLQDFQPNTYRLMQLSNFPMPITLKHKSLFYSERNRIEFISDFPVGNDAEVIHSLQIHPQGWSVLSRNTSSENSSEWTSIHDIQDLDPETIKKFEDSKEKSKENDFPTVANLRHSYVIPSARSFGANNRELDPYSEIIVPLRSSENPTLSSRIELPIRSVRNNLDSNDNSDDDVEDRVFYLGERSDSSATNTSNSVQPGEIGEMQRSSSPDESPGTSGTSDVYSRSNNNNNSDSSSSSTTSAARERRCGFRRPSFALRRRSSLRPTRTSNSYNNAPRPLSDLAVQSIEGERSEIRGQNDNRLPNIFHNNVLTIRTGVNNDRAILVLPRDSRPDEGQHPDIVQNIPRLTNYIEEPNKVRGFIKELCFSSDGRLICSPFDCGVRLLMFDDKCSELSHCIGPKPQQLCAVSTNICHNSCVVSTKFSPVDCQLVSGCLNGKIVWHQPII